MFRLALRSALRRAPLALGLLAAACSTADDPPVDPVDPGGPLVEHPTDSLLGLDLDSDGDGDLVVPVPLSADPRIRALFARYTAVVTPAGERVHILGQSGLSNAQLRRLREVLREHLANEPGTAYGADKADVRAALVARRATLAVFRDAAAASLNLSAVSAFLGALGDSAVVVIGERVVTEGSPGYMAAAPARDETFGATAALVHRLALRDLRPGYAAELSALTQSALASGRLTAPAGLSAEALDEAFVRVALEVHAGAFGHGPRQDGRAGDDVLYAYDTRPEMAAADPALVAWIEAFFASEQRFLARIEPAFAGTFDLRFDPARPHSHRAQYLRNLVLTGSNPCELIGSPGADVLRGNVADNVLQGGGGDDLLVGGAGVDTAAFSGPRAGYTFFLEGGKWVVEDVWGIGEGRDVLEQIERLRFSDMTLDL